MFLIKPNGRIYNDLFCLKELTEMKQVRFQHFSSECLFFPFPRWSMRFIFESLLSAPPKINSNFGLCWRMLICLCKEAFLHNSLCFLWIHKNQSIISKKKIFPQSLSLLLLTVWWNPVHLSSSLSFIHPTQLPSPLAPLCSSASPSLCLHRGWWRIKPLAWPICSDVVQGEGPAFIYVTSQLNVCCPPASESCNANCVQTKRLTLERHLL